MQLVTSALGFLGIAPAASIAKMLRNRGESDRSPARSQLQRAIMRCARLEQRRKLLLKKMWKAKLGSKQRVAYEKQANVVAKQLFQCKKLVIQLKARARKQGTQVDDTLEITSRAAPEAAESDLVEAPDENLSGMLGDFAARSWSWKGLLLAGILGAVAGRRLWK